MTRHVHALDWSRTVAYAATPSSQGINIVDRLPGSEDPMPEDVRAKIAQDIAAASARASAVPLTGGRWSRRCGRASRHSPARSRSSAPTSRWCSPTAARCRSCPRRRSSPGARSRAAITAGRASSSPPGPGIRAGASVEELSIVDVAPLLLHQLGLPVPDDMAGQRARVDLRARRARAPTRPRTPPRAPRRSRSSSLAANVELEPEEQAALMERLRALGYVE